MEDPSQFDALDVCEPAESLSLPPLHPHRLEEDVQRELLAHPHLQFSSLVVRRVPGGVCLEGVLESCEPRVDVSTLVQRIAGVEQVLNHLVVRRPALKG